MSRYPPDSRRVGDWQGCIARTARELTSGRVRIPAGTLVAVDHYSSRGASIEGAQCPTCGVAVRMTRLAPSDLVFIERVATPYNNGGSSLRLYPHDERALQRRLVELAAADRGSTPRGDAPHSPEVSP